MPIRDDTIDKVECFLAELSEISTKHGIGISGEAVLFMLENEDHVYKYVIDDESRLIRT